MKISKRVKYNEESLVSMRGLAIWRIENGVLNLLIMVAPSVAVTDRSRIVEDLERNAVARAAHEFSGVVEIS